MHHLTDDELTSSLKRHYDLLHSEGVICHSFWEGEGYETFKGLFVNYHNSKSLKNIFSNHFKILLLESYKEFDEDDSILLIAIKK